LVVNFALAEKNPNGFQNVQLWGQAQEQMANQPAPAPPPKGTVSLTIKGDDAGDPAATAALVKAGIIPEGVQTTTEQTRQEDLQAKQQDAAQNAQIH
jgi:hypothetical protein